MSISLNKLDKQNGQILNQDDIATYDNNFSEIETIIEDLQNNEGIATKINQSLAFLNSLSDTYAKYNFEVIEGTRDNIPFTELWILINARYDGTSGRFKRVNIEDNSFGWQFQGGGTYPGESSIGDYINQGVNLWRALGKKSFTAGDGFYENITEDIGEELSDGTWGVYGYYLGWNNCFMYDSYGGMTVGGAGFEIDGNGISPYKRLTSSKFSGTSTDSTKTIKDYLHMYNGTCWNAYHGLSNSDDLTVPSYFFGMESPVDFYHGSSYNASSDYADMDKAKYVIKRLPANTTSKYEDWANVLELNHRGELIINPIDVPVSATITEATTTMSSTDTTVSIAYPSGFNATNTNIEYWHGTKSDGTVVEIEKLYVAYSFTDYGIYASTGSGYTSITVGLSQKLGSNYEGVNIVNAKTGDRLVITNDGNLLFNGKKVLLEGDV